MEQTLKGFKAIMADKRERKEFLGGFACVIVTMLIVYIVIVIFH